jgi:hypothetical protein
MNSISSAVIVVLYFAFIVQFSLSYKTVDKGRVLYSCILVCLWTFDGLKIVLLMSVTFERLES